MKRFYFTFGMGQPNADKYVVVWATDWDRAREVMMRYYGNVWSMQYDEESFLLSLRQGFFLNLTPFELNKPLQPKLPKLINRKEADDIIESRTPLGKYITQGEEGWLGIDNETGEAWVEPFDDFATALRWHYNN